MSDAIAMTGAAPADVAALNGSRGGQQASFDPIETRMFARMMQNMPTPPTAMAPSSIRDAAMAVAAQLSGKNRTIEDMRRTMLESVDLRDPLRTMVAMTDLSMQAHATFSKLHIATGLASAATSLFGGLLKNQQ